MNSTDLKATKLYTHDKLRPLKPAKGQTLSSNISTSVFFLRSCNLLPEFNHTAIDRFEFYIERIGDTWSRTDKFRSSGARRVLFSRFFQGLSILCAMIAILAITVCTSRKCGKPGCPGLRKAAEFDIQLETEECVKNSSNLPKDGVKKGLFELRLDHHRELETELKKMAPPNGRAVLVFRARCGCSVGRMEVPGQKKPRKVKK
ncbi:hypothetical protein F0562_004408 [Nyssa sinensis]|uniref:Ribosomal protein L34e superfamily protein n=1 Tax=Nyssa sinensis TaxID=561372 RepID=A0A5J5BYI5_9ASTE|nr:hypothetical protein F0562_004408 [Nyssa sinensis]